MNFTQIIPQYLRNHTLSIIFNVTFRRFKAHLRFVSIGFTQEYRSESVGDVTYI